MAAWHGRYQTLERCCPVARSERRPVTRALHDFELLWHPADPRHDNGRVQAAEVGMNNQYGLRWHHITCRVPRLIAAWVALIIGWAG
jgi:hypothetical protein